MILLCFILILLLILALTALSLILHDLKIMNEQMAYKKKANAGFDVCVHSSSKTVVSLQKKINELYEQLAEAEINKLKKEQNMQKLLTNVSHDIKTPLTSIINYVDLLTKEDVENPKVQEYLEVLTRQSARLKKLIEDLIEASKASSGVLKVNWEKCVPEVLLTQAAGEYEERLQAKNLELVIHHPEEELSVLADGRHLWRVFDNLLNNIYKYAQPGTRVYLDLEQDERNVSIVFRNISKSPLHMTGEELQERFVRGDSSRNTEGSGLGLSIAQSLTELMHGSFHLLVDGDFFKVTLTFPRNTENA